LTTFLALWSVLAAEPVKLADIRNPYGLVEGPDHKIYVCSIDDHTIYRIDRKSNQVEPYVTGQNEPYEIRFGPDGHLYFVDMKDHVIRRVDKKSRAVTVVAGTGEAGFAGDGGPAARAQFNQPHAIQFDPQGRLLVCDIRNHRVRRIDLKTGRIETVLGGPDRPVRGPRAIDFARDGTMWLALREGNAVWRYRSLESAPEVIAEKLHGPKGIAVSPDGGVYIADTESHEVSRIDPRTGQVTVVLGGLKRPHGIYINARNEIFIGDSENHRVLLLDGNRLQH
jgi:DNA-binding beta-propeller fold protein YncE